MLRKTERMEEWTGYTMPRQVDMTTGWVDNSQVKGLIIWLLAVMSRRTYELSYGGKKGKN